MASQRLERIINAVINRDGNSAGETMVVANHVSQMKTFGIRQGVELYPRQDTYGVRKRFIDQLWLHNELEIHLDRLWELFLCRGSILFYLRPTGDGNYDIKYFHGHTSESKSQFRVFYDRGGEMEEVVIIYSYRTATTSALPSARRWLKIRIRKDVIIQSEHEVRPDFSTDFNPSGAEELQNSLGFIPCVICRNHPMEDGQSADEFSWLGSQIEYHDDLATNIRENMRFFGNPMLITTRTSKEVLEGGMGGAQTPTVYRPSMASQSGFIGADIPFSTRVDDPGNRGGSSLRIRRVIGGVEADERFGFIHPDPISPDHARYEAQYRENIRTALGGVDELGISTGATAFEIQSLFGRAATTALKKCRGLYKFGLCKLFALAIFAEEENFRNSMAAALKKTPEEINEQLVKDLYEKGKIPDGVFGLPPDGDREIKWRFLGEVYEESPRDKLQKSIIVRNLREEGVNREEALKFLYPDKTEAELSVMIDPTRGGYPYRQIQNVATATQQMLGLQSNLMQIPDPENPQMPLAARFNLTPLLTASFANLATEISQGQEYINADPTTNPKRTAAPTEQLSRGTRSTDASTPATNGGTRVQQSGTDSRLQPGVQPGIPYSTGLSSTGGIPTGVLSSYGYIPAPGAVLPDSYPLQSTESGYGYASPNNPLNPIQPGQAVQQQSLAGGIPGGNGVPEFSSPIPNPGSVVSQPGATASNPVFNQPGIPTNPISPNTPASIWELLLPSYTAAFRTLRGGTSAKRPKRQRNG